MDELKNALKKKVFLAILKWASPALVPVIIFLLILVTACLIALMIFAGDTVYIDSSGLEGDEFLAAVDYENIVLATSYPSEDPDLWLIGDVDINRVFASRLAALAKHYNKKLNITSGYRSVQEQWAIWNQRIKDHPNETEAQRRKWVGYPGKSRHQFGIASDVDGFAKELSNQDLKPFGLVKPLPNEDWHIEPLEARITSSAPQVLPEELKYIEINKEGLKSYLISRNSILAEDRYLDAIVKVSKTKGVNPLILFAITGQEQSYVPKSSPYAEKIANNPFNVYNSWVKYNTNIEDSASIAANTIINLSRGRPDTIHPLQWINRKYAEDQNWWIGVSKNFTALKKVALI